MPLLPSAFDALAIDTVGATTTASSLVIVPVAVAIAELGTRGVRRGHGERLVRLDGRMHHR